jgi:oligogalacturonide transport system substrate-binding protein
MKKNGRVILIALLVAIVFVAIFVATSLSDKDEDVTVENDSVSISFSWWGNDGRHAYTMEGVDVFQELNEDVEVSCRYGEWNGYEKRMKVRMKSHNEADVMQINYAWLTEYSSDGEGYYDLYSLSDYIDLSNFSEDDLKYGEVNGKLNAIPIAFNTSSMFFNQTIFDEYNLELPETWDDYFEVAKTLSQHDIYVLGCSKKQLFLLMIAYFEQTTGEHAFSDDGQLLLDTDDMEYILEFYKRLIDEKVLLPIDQFDRPHFVNGQIAGTMIWVSDAGNYCDALEEAGGEPVLGEYPMAKNAKLSGWYKKPATMYAISNITEHPEESAKLLDFLLNSTEMADLQKTEKGIPVSAAAVEELKENDDLGEYEYAANTKMLDEEDSMNVMIPVMEQDDVLNTFKQTADEYLYDKMNITECAQTICQGINEAIAAQ